MSVELSEVTAITGGSRIIVPKLVDAAAVAASSQYATSPVASVQHKHRGKVWRATGCASEYIDVDFGADYNEYHTINCLALVNHNMRGTATLTITAGESQGDDSIVSASVFDPWPTVWGFGEGGFGEHGWGGTTSEDEDEIYFPAGNLRLIYFDQSVLARWWRIAIADPDNPAGFIRVGRLILETHLESTRRVKVNMPNLPYDPSAVSKTLGGQSWKDMQTQRFQATYEFQHTPGDETYELWYRFLATIGTAGPFVGDFLPEADNGLMRFLNQRYWEIPKDAIQPITVPLGDKGNIVLSVEESL